MWIWLGLAALLIGELATGSVLFAAGGPGLAGGVAAWLNAGLEWQLLACGVVVLLGLVILRKTRVLKSVDAASNADVNLDIGQIVSVEAWSDNRTAASGIAALTGRLNWPRGTRPMAASMSSPNCAARAWCSRPGMHPAARASPGPAGRLGAPCASGASGQPTKKRDTP